MNQFKIFFPLFFSIESSCIDEEVERNLFILNPFDAMADNEEVEAIQNSPQLKDDFENLPLFSFWKNCEAV